MKTKGVNRVPPRSFYTQTMERYLHSYTYISIRRIRICENIQSFCRIYLNAFKLIYTFVDVKLRNCANRKEANNFGKKSNRHDRFKRWDGGVKSKFLYRSKFKSTYT